MIDTTTSPHLATHIPTYPPISMLTHSSTFLAIRLSSWLSISLHRHPLPYLATHIPAWPSISLFSHPSPHLDTQFPGYSMFCWCTDKHKPTKRNIVGVEGDHGIFLLSSSITSNRLSAIEAL